MSNRGTFPMMILALVTILAWTWLPVGAQDMDEILNRHDPRTDAPASRGTATPAPRPAEGIGDGNAPTPQPTDVKEIDELLKTLEELVKILETLTDKAVPDAPKKPGKDTGKKGKYPVTGTVEVNTSLNIRTSPWGKIIGSFHNGDQVTIIGREGDWYKISWNGRTAYCHANYVGAPGAPAGRTPVREPGSSGGGQASPPPASPSGSGFGAMPCSPMPSRASSEFGMRRHPTTGQYKMHNGIDLPVPSGTRLNALGDGVVTAVGYESGGGRYIMVRYANGLESFYCHLQSTSAKQGQRVSMGQEIARSDNTGQWTTGAHLHMGIKKNGQYINPRSVLKLP